MKLSDAGPQQMLLNEAMAANLAGKGCAPVSAFAAALKRNNPAHNIMYFILWFFVVTVNAIQLPGR